MFSSTNYQIHILKKASFAFFLILLLHSCDNSAPENNTIIQHRSDSYISSPASGRKYVCHAEIPIELSLRNIPNDLDSVYIYLDQKLIYSSTEKKERYNFSYQDSLSTVGSHLIKTVLIKKSGKEEQYLSFIFTSNLIPENYSYSIIKKYPHDPNAYTQGLVFDNGLLYEGTGLRGKSELRLVNLSDGKIIKSVAVINNLFGEGITVVGDKIYQLTYQANKGFVYRKNNFDLIKEFNYHTEGWGLTTDGKNLIYSDGSEKLFFLDTTHFSIVKTLEVYDDHGAVTRLNELEWIEGEIWANIYTTDDIIRIDPTTGKVIGKINMSGLLSPEDYQGGNVDVLNGIAYEPKSKKIYVTGKNFPWIWEVQIKK